MREATLGEEEEQFAIDVIGEWTGGQGLVDFQVLQGPVRFLKFQVRPHCQGMS